MSQTSKLFRVNCNETCPSCCCIFFFSSRLISSCLSQCFQLTGCFVFLNVISCKRIITVRHFMKAPFTQQLNNRCMKVTRITCSCTSCECKSVPRDTLQMNQLNTVNVCKCQLNSWDTDKPFTRHTDIFSSSAFSLSLPVSLWYNLTHVDSSQEQKHTEQAKQPRTVKQSERRKKKKEREGEVNCSCNLYFLLN